MNHEQYLKEKAENQSDNESQKKIDQFQEWLLDVNGDVEFPFFKNLPEVKQPKHYD